MSRNGVHEGLKAKFLEFFEVNDVRDKFYDSLNLFYRLTPQILNTYNVSRFPSQEEQVLRSKIQPKDKSAVPEDNNLSLLQDTHKSGKEILASPNPLESDSQMVSQAEQGSKTDRVLDESLRKERAELIATTQRQETAKTAENKFGPLPPIKIETDTEPEQKNFNQAKEKRLAESASLPKVIEDIIFNFSSQPNLLLGMIAQ